MSITPYEEPQAPALTLAEALDEYRLAVEAVGRYRMDHADVLNELELHEQAAAEAKDAITALMTESDLDFIEDEHHAVSLVRTDRGSYDPARLPDWLRNMPGVITETVDAKTVKKVLKNKHIATDEEREAIADAWQSNPAKPYAKITTKEATR